MCRTPETSRRSADPGSTDPADETGVEPHPGDAVPSCRELAGLLGARLQDAVPDGVVVTADGADVVVRIDGDESRNGAAAILDERDGRPVDEAISTAAWAILSHVQDAVAEATAEPWPGTGTVLPLPGAEIRDGRLHAWFGDREAPVLVVVGEADAWPPA